MTAPVTRRGLLGRAVAAGAGVGLAAVPVALACPGEAAVDPVTVMDAEYQRMQAAIAPVREAFASASAAITGHPRVQVGRLLHPGTDDPPTPIYAYSAVDIREKLKAHRNGYIALCGADSAAVRWLDTECARLIAELEAEQQRIAEIEEATGAAALERQLNELCDAQDALEDRIAETIATSPAGLAAQMRILARYLEGDGYTATVATNVIAGLAAMQAKGDRT